MSVPEGSKIILRTEVGSRVHGIAVKGTDDRDEMEIVVPPTSHVLGLREFSSCMPRTAPDGQRSEPGHLDLVSHSLRKYCGLALKGNPSVLSARGTRHSHHHPGEVLRNMAPSVASKKCGPPFLGYVESQRTEDDGRARPEKRE